MKIISCLKVLFGFIILSFLFLCYSNTYSQDVITTKRGARKLVNIIDTAGGKVVYTPIQEISNIEIDSIVFKNGSVKVFNVIDTSQKIKRLALGNKVLVEAKEYAIEAHATESLQKWDYWNVVDKIDDCDFIMHVEVTFNKKAVCHIQLLSPIDRSLILDVPTSYVLFGDTFNFKRACIIKNIGEKLIPLIIETNK